MRQSCWWLVGLARLPHMGQSLGKAAWLGACCWYRHLVPMLQIVKRTESVCADDTADVHAGRKLSATCWRLVLPWMLWTCT